MTDLFYLNKDILREEARNFFEQDFPEQAKDVLIKPDGTKKYGNSYNQYFGVYRHVYGSAVLTREFGSLVADTLGKANEIDLYGLRNNPPAEKNQDLWNNAVGREIGSDNPSGRAIADRIKAAFGNGDLIIDINTDQRIYEKDVVSIAIKKGSASKTIADTLMIGENTFDTFYLPSLSGHDYITSSANDGKIQIGSTVLSGNALPKTGVNGDVIAGSWTLAGFDISQAGADLVISQAGANIGLSSTPKITVKNFPFSQSRGGFGVTLGKKADLALDADGNLVSALGYSSQAVPLADKRRFMGGPFLQTADDKFFGVLLYDTTGGSSGFRYKIGKFNSAGVQIDQIELNDDYPITNVAGPIKYLNPITGKEMWLAPFTSFTTDGTTYQSRVGICLIDEAGERKSQIIAGATDLKFASGGAFLQKKYEVDDDQVNPENFNNVFGFTYTRTVGTISNRVLQNVDITTLEKLGDEIIISGNFRVNFDASSQLTFLSGNRVRISQQEGTIVQVDTPILRDLTPAEIISNRNLQAGKQNTDPAIKEQILAFQPAAKTDLDVLENSNSITALLGFNPSQNQMSLPVADRSQVQIYSTNSNQYSLEDLLSGKFDQSVTQLVSLSASNRKLTAEEQAQTDRDAAIMKEWESAFTPEELRKLATTKFDILNGTFSNSTDDAYDDAVSVDDDNDDSTDETILEDVAQPYTVIVLPNNQTVILVGVNATEVAKTPEVYFLTAAEITQSPSGRPSSQPSAVPSSDPIALPSAAPTHNPIAGDLIMPSSLPSGLPSSQPSGWPSSDPTQDPTGRSSSQPSAVPSSDPIALPSAAPTHNPIAGDLIMPSSLPSGLPSSQPSRWPSGDPTQDPTNNPSSNPSSEPTQKPSLRKYAPSAIPSFVATERNTNSPSSQPSQIPWQKPTARPSQKPTALVSLDDSAIPTSRPSWNPTTNNPSSNPSSISPAPSAATTVISTPDFTESQTQFQTPLQTPFQTSQNSLSPTSQLTNRLTDPSNSKPSNQMSATEIGLITGGTVAFVGLVLGAAYKFLTRSGQKQSTVHPKAPDHCEEDVERNSGNRSGGKAR